MVRNPACGPGSTASAYAGGPGSAVRLPMGSCSYSAVWRHSSSDLFTVIQQRSAPHGEQQHRRLARSCLTKAAHHAPFIEIARMGVRPGSFRQAASNSSINFRTWSAFHCTPMNPGLKGSETRPGFPHRTCAILFQPLQREPRRNPPVSPAPHTNRAADGIRERPDGRRAARDRRYGPGIHGRSFSQDLARFNRRVIRNFLSFKIW
jgi:hypothetical protein